VSVTPLSFTSTFLTVASQPAVKKWQSSSAPSMAACRVASVVVLAQKSYRSKRHHYQQTHAAKKARAARTLTRQLNEVLPLPGLGSHRSRPPVHQSFMLLFFRSFVLRKNQLFTGYPTRILSTAARWLAPHF